MTHPGMGYFRREGLILVAEEAVEIRVLRRQGKSIREIARVLNLSRNTVRRYLRSGGLPRYQRCSGQAQKAGPWEHLPAVENASARFDRLRDWPAQGSE